MANGQIERLELRRAIRHEPLLREMVGSGLMIAGGYPLWLTGQADFYGDIDLYAKDWTAYFRWHKRLCALHETGEITHYKRGTNLNFRGDAWQIIHPAQSCEAELLLTPDLSASSCVLVLDERDEWSLWSYYADDIRNRVCRVLDRHAWTEQRIDLYKRKGLEIIE